MHSTRPVTMLRASLAALFISALCLPSVHAAPPRAVSYTVEVTDPSSKIFHVVARAEGVTDEKVSFAIPAWSPGWYVLTHAYKNVGNVSATSETGATLTVAHPDNLTWTVDAGKAKDVILRYDLTARDNDPDAVGAGSGTDEGYGFFAPYLDREHGWVPGPASLLYVSGATQVRSTVHYKVPTGWSVASANDPVAGETNTFSASDYDTLADQPAELGKFQRFDKAVNGVPFSVVLVGADGVSSRQFVDSCWKIADAGLRVLGNPGGTGPAPFPRYIFFFHLPAKSLGIEGLEHKNSTVIRMPVRSVEEADTTALSVTAHEFTHAWNVKRIRSRALGPFDYTREVRTKDLWWLEGVTDYYAPRLLVEAGLANRRYWQAYISEILTNLQNNPARTKVTLEEASLKAWEGRSEGYGGLSYYEKGLVVGLLMDIEMRHRTGGKIGLDDVMRELFKQQVTTGKGFADGEIERIASRLAGSDMKPFFDRTLRSTEELPLNILTEGGLRLQKTPIRLPDVGIDIHNISEAPGGLRVENVTEESVLGRAGAKSGDVITEINNRPITEVLGSLTGFAKPGETVNLTVQRGDAVRHLTLTVGTQNVTIYALGLVSSPTEEQETILGHVTGTAKTDD